MAPFSLAVDVGCGSGQSTFPLAQHFERVVGIDISAAQILEGQNQPDKPPNVELRVGSAFNIPLTESSASLVCCGTAAHWFDPIEDFYREADRVLVPGGCLAVFANGIPRVAFAHNLSKEINEAISLFLGHQGILDFRPKHSYDVSDCYSNYRLPYEDQTRTDSLECLFDWNANQLSGYFKSLSFYQKYLRDTPDGEDPAPILENRILDVLSASGESTIPVEFPIFVLLGRKPFDTCK